MSLEERILESATRNFVRHGVLAARLEDIRSDAGVSVGAIYHYFPDKQALHAAAFVRALVDYQAGFIETLQESEDAEAGVKGAVRYHLRWIASNRDAAALLLGEPPTGSRAEPLAEQNRGFFTAVLRWWRIHASYGVLRAVDPGLLHALWLGPGYEYCRHWLAGRDSKLPGRPANPREVADELADAAWTVLQGDARR